MAALEASVIICTRDRAAQLSRVLASACDLSLPPDTGWELIVVDNGSSDATAGVIESFAKRLPLRRVEEPEAGVCNARNRGIEMARGAYICWADDDVLLDRGWLAAYLAAFRRHPDAAFFGGPIHPVLEPPSPAVFDRCSACWPLTGAYAQRDFGPDELPLSVAEGIMPWGANLAVRSEEQRRFRFNAALGPSPEFDRLGDESDVLYRLTRAGATGWWVPDAAVQHVIPLQRQTLAYLIAYYRRSGETAAFLRDRFPDENALEMQGPLPFVSQPTAWLWARLPVHRLRAIAAWMANRPCARLGHFANYGYDMGVIAYRRAAARGRANRRLG